MLLSMKLEGIDHVALAVRDLEASERWYREVLGLERRYEEVWGDTPTIVGTGTTNLAFFPRNERDAPYPEGGLPSLRHIAFRVDAANFAAAREELAARGIETTFQDHEAAHSIYFEDLDGYRLEITTYDL